MTTTLSQNVQPKPYEKGERYNFTVKQMNYPSFSIVRERRATGRCFYVKLPDCFREGDKIQLLYEKDCRRKNSYGNYVKKPVFSDPRFVIDLRKDESSDKSFEQWSVDVEGLAHHECGKEFDCSCCHRHHPSNKGVKIDDTIGGAEVYFCYDCWNRIYQPKRKGRPIIIYTPHPRY